MTATACLAIGIGDAPPLAYLRGAVNGAHAIARWAREQGMETRLLTDERDAVERADVKAALEELLAAVPELLVLYFAGHGLSRAAGEDLWLLSRWEEENIGLSVAGLRNMLSHYGLKRLVVVSDACRTPVDADTQTLGTDQILSRRPFDESVPQLDQWQAASRGRAAFMIPGDTPEATRCIFSGLMEEALSGAHADAFDADDPARPITSFRLADFLEREVPARAATYGVPLRPVITTSIRPPHNRYRQGPPATPPAFPVWPDPAQAQLLAMSAVAEDARIAPPPGASWTTRSAVPEREMAAAAPAPSPHRQGGAIASFWNRLKDRLGAEAAGPAASVETSPPPAADIPTLEMVAADDQARIAESEASAQQRVDAIVAEFRAELRPDHFETRAGLVLSGAAATTVLCGGHAQPDFFEDGRIVRLNGPYDPAASRFWRGSHELQRPMPLLVGLSTGDWAATVSLPGFLQTLGVGANGVETALFRAMDMPPDRAAEETVARLMAAGLSAEQTPEVVAALRAGKHADPMLGVIAAWLHHAAGDIDNIHRTAFYFAQVGQPVPFDLALLGRLEAHHDAEGTVRVAIPPVSESGRASLPGYMRAATGAAEADLAGAAPLLRQGWALLDPAGRGELYPAGMAELARHLRPAPFTTLDADGGQKLAALLSLNPKEQP